MREYTYHKDVEIQLLQFANAFNDIMCKRYNSDGTVDSLINVDFKYSPKTRTLYDIINKSGTIRVPVVAFTVGGISRDVNRVFNNIEGSYLTTNPYVSGSTHLRQPLPINITINLSIYAKYQSDIDQIIQNVCLFCDPYVVVSYPWPDMPDLEVRTPIEWSGSFSIQYPFDIPATTEYRIIADTSFTLKGWLFKNIPTGTGIIYKIDHTFTAVSALGTYNYMHSIETSAITDYWTISARPQVWRCIPYMVMPSATASFNLIGTMFDYVCSLYVSGSQGVYPDSTYVSATSAWTYGMTYFNPFSASTKLSAMYPGFSAIAVSAWNEESSSVLSFTMPPALAPGCVDVIAMNEAGYGKLIQDGSKRRYLYPSASGIQVLG